MALRERIGRWLLKADEGQKTPIEAGIIAIASGQAPKNTVSGADPDTWMSPHQPLAPQQPNVQGRQWDFPVGVNLQYTPRGTEPTSFAQLRALADGYDLLRLLIETRKDQLVKFQFNISPIEDEEDAKKSKTKPGATKKKDPRCAEIEQFFKFPNKRNNWQTWLRALVEELLVTDAACIYPRMTRGGDPYSLDLMDGTTLKMVVDESGRRPEPPGVAYQQVLKGIPAVNYTSDELIYAPRNVRINRLYGYSPVEQIIMTVNIGLRRQLHTLQYYTEGNIPEALATVPKEWNVDQIAAYQKYWDNLLEGNTAMRRHLKFIPDGTKYYPTKEDALKDVFDEWLARVCCYAFSLPPSPFVRDQNRATSESAHAAALEEGLLPLMTWIKDLIDLCLWKYWGYQDLEFKWKDDEPVDPNILSQIEDRRVRNGVLSVDEVRADIGRDAIGMTNAIYTGGGATLIEDVLNPPEPVMPPGMLGPDGKPALPQGGKGFPPKGGGFPPKKDEGKGGGGFPPSKGKQEAQPAGGLPAQQKE